MADDSQAESLVTVARYPNASLGEIARILLEQSGIPVRLENANTVTALWHYGTALGDVEVRVPEQCASEAHELIQDIQYSGLPEDVSDVNDAAPRCLACGADFPASQDRCPSCGWSFEDAAAGELSESDVDNSEPEIESMAAGPESVAESGSGTLTGIRNLGRPLIGIWMAVGIGALMVGLMSGVLGILQDMFR